LILVRASILGMLMPASNDAKKDREFFLKVLTMDDQGAWEGCKDFSSPVLWRTMDDHSRSMVDALQVALNDEVAANQLGLAPVADGTACSAHLAR